MFPLDLRGAQTLLDVQPRSRAPCLTILHAKKPSLSMSVPNVLDIREDKHKPHTQLQCPNSHPQSTTSRARRSRVTSGYALPKLPNDHNTCKCSKMVLLVHAPSNVLFLFCWKRKLEMLCFFFFGMTPAQQHTLSGIHNSCFSRGWRLAWSIIPVSSTIRDARHTFLTRQVTTFIAINYISSSYLSTHCRG